ncbi:stalk domain-containing protein [Paenibacillus sp. DMB5]|uniref:stalk domain-containing protein n=1 Tax=Paenibacillus sp. DMB5 TaxID=1780103 RepID=UPI00076DD462|nr:stalk domain-containing protein [Paenibacillus sp. DMB5]KUP23109.1 hypothetical protein AWJ19_22795 [Paenibacillus sp. DMB5]
MTKDRGKLPMLKKSGQFIAGVLVGATLFGGTAVFAANTAKIDVVVQNLKYYFDGVEKKPDADKQGFIYKGTTYVPLRFVSESLGEDVSWDGKTSSIYVGKQGNGTITYLEDMKTLSSSASNKVKNISEFTTNTGLKFYHGIETTSNYNYFSLTNEYILNGDYKKFEAFIAPSNYWANRAKKEQIGGVKIVGDGKELFKTEISSYVTEPVKIDVDLTGVLQLEITFYDTDDGFTNSSNFGLLDAKFIQ